MYIRVFRPSEDKELLVNLDHVSKIGKDKWCQEPFLSRQMACRLRSHARTGTVLTAWEGGRGTIEMSSSWTAMAAISNGLRGTATTASTVWNFRLTAVGYFSPRITTVLRRTSTRTYSRSAEATEATMAPSSPECNIQVDPPAMRAVWRFFWNGYTACKPLSFRRRATELVL